MTAANLITTRAARLAAGAWGVLHIAGGALLAATALNDGPTPALRDLAGNAAANDLPARPGPVVEGLIAFHGLNIAVFGSAVLVLSLLTRASSIPVALAVMTAADIGLVVFLLAPGHMPWTEGAWGPLLLAVAAAAYLASRRRGTGLLPAPTR